MRRLSNLGYATVNTDKLDVGEALIQIGNWLLDHPETTLVSININWAVSDEENYVTAIVDCVEDSDLTNKP